MTNPSSSQPKRVGLIILVFIAFISLGLPDGLLGVAWPSIRQTFSLPLSAMGWILLGGTSGYMLSSFISGKLLGWLGVGGLLASSCALTGLSLISYTLAPVFPLMALLFFFGGLGAGAIDAGINTWVAANQSERVMQWLHASWGIGVTMGPAIMTLGLSLYADWHFGYRVVGAAQLLLGGFFALTIPRWKQAEAASREQKPRITDFRTPLWETFSRPQVWLSLLLFYVYVGAEISLGHWGYSLLSESRGLPLELAGALAGSYWAFFTIGRLLAGAVTSRFGMERIMTAALLTAVGGCLLLWWNPYPWVSAAGLAITGLAIAPLFPGFVSGTEQRVGARHAANTIGMQVTASGFAVFSIPGMVGVLAQRVGLEILPPFLTAIYALLFVLYRISLNQGPAGQTDGSN